MEIYNSIISGRDSLAFVHPFVRGVNSINVSSKDHFCPKRKLYDFQLLFVYEGKISFEFKDDLITLNDGDAIIIPPNLLYKEIINENDFCHYFIVHFDFIHVKEKEKFTVKDMYLKYCNSKYNEAPFLQRFVLDNDPNFSIIDGPIVYRENQLSVFATDFSQLYEIYIHETMSPNMSVCLLFNSILLKAIYNLENKEPIKSINSKYYVCDKFIQYVEGNFQNQINIEEFAVKNGYSPNYFRRLFIESMNVSPSIYLLRKRMSQAVIYIKKDLPIAIVAEKVGFKDPFYFSKAFKKYYGVSPKTYQKNGIE